MCDWLGVDLEPDDYQQTMEKWIPNHNKFPADGQALYARELFARQSARIHFHVQLGQGMLQSSCGFRWIHWEHGVFSQLGTVLGR